MHHILLVEEEGAEIGAAGGQHGFVCLEVDPIYDEGAVTQQALLTLAVELLQNFPAVPRELHRTAGVRMAKFSDGYLRKRKGMQSHLFRWLSQLDN